VILVSLELLESAVFELSVGDTAPESRVFAAPFSVGFDTRETCEPEDGVESAPVRWAAEIKIQSQTAADTRYFRETERIA